MTEVSDSITAVKTRSGPEMRYLSLLLSYLLFAGCTSPPLSQTLESIPQTEILRDIGRHQLPFQPNKRFVLLAVGPEPGVYEDAPIIMDYVLDGKRKKWKMGGPRSTDGYVTELGWFLESSPVDDLMQERVVRLASGEQIVVIGNTIQKGEIRLRALKSDKDEGFGRKSLDDFVKR